MADKKAGGAQPPTNGFLSPLCRDVVGVSDGQAERRSAPRGTSLRVESASLSDRGVEGRSVRYGADHVVDMRAHGVEETPDARTHQLTLALLKQNSAADTLRAMAAALAEDFQGDLVRIVSFRPVVGLDDADWLQVIDQGDKHVDPFRDCLADGEPLCGRLQPDKHALLYGARADEVQSSALLPMPGQGLIAVGSLDPNRFYPGMGTLFLRMMAESLATALRRFDG